MQSSVGSEAISPVSMARKTGPHPGGAPVAARKTAAKPRKRSRSPFPAFAAAASSSGGAPAPARASRHKSAPSAAATAVPRPPTRKEAAKAQIDVICSVLLATHQSLRVSVRFEFLFRVWADGGSGQWHEDNVEDFMEEVMTGSDGRAKGQPFKYRRAGFKLYCTPGGIF
eukprot:SAG22_NODE_1056_length_5777_cov_137.240402_4_plen_170_part_00